jgi:hypothetical protein
MRENRVLVEHQRRVGWLSLGPHLMTSRQREQLEIGPACSLKG